MNYKQHSIYKYGFVFAAFCATTNSLSMWNEKSYDQRSSLSSSSEEEWYTKSHTYTVDQTAFKEAFAATNTSLCTKYYATLSSINTMLSHKGIVRVVNSEGRVVHQYDGRNESSLIELYNLSKSDHQQIRIQGIIETRKPYTIQQQDKFESRIRPQEHMF